MKKRKNRLFFYFVIGIVCCISIFFYTDVRKKSDRDEDRIDRIGLLENRIEEELSKGNSFFSVYINKKIKKEELQEINKNLDGFYGCVKRYSQRWFPFSDYYRTDFYLEISENYYVLKNLQDGYIFKRTQTGEKRLAEEVKRIQEMIITEDMSDYEITEAVHDYLVSNTEYEEKTETKGESKAYSPYGVLIDHKGVCSGYTQAFQIFMELNGIESRIVLGTADGVRHSWNMVCLDDEWYHVDTTWDDPVPDRKDLIIPVYLNVTDEFMEQSHEWDRKKYPEAEGRKYNYYVQNKSVVKNEQEFLEFMQEELKNRKKMITCLVKGYRESVYTEEVFKKGMEGTDLKSLNLEMTGERNHMIFIMVPEYGRSRDD